MRKFLPILIRIEESILLLGEFEEMTSEVYPDDYYQSTILKLAKVSQPVITIAIGVNHFRVKGGERILSHGPMYNKPTDLIVFTRSDNIVLVSCREHHAEIDIVDDKATILLEGRENTIQTKVVELFKE